MPRPNFGTLRLIARFPFWQHDSLQPSGSGYGEVWYQELDTLKAYRQLAINDSTWTLTSQVLLTLIVYFLLTRAAVLHCNESRI